MDLLKSPSSTSSDEKRMEDSTTNESNNINSSNTSQQQQEQSSLKNNTTLSSISTSSSPPSSSSSSASTNNNNSNTNNNRPNDSSQAAETLDPSSAVNKLGGGEEPSLIDKQQQQQHVAKNNNNHEQHLPRQRNPSEDLFSTKRWGVTPIRQDTPWELPPSPTSSTNNNQQPQQPSSSFNASAVAAAAAAASAAASRPIGSGINSAAVAATLGSINSIGGGSTLPPGISQSGDSFRSSGASAINDFHSPTAMVNNFAVDSMGGNGLANSLGHMNLGGASGTGVLHSSRFDQPWRAPSAKPHQSPMASSSSPFAAHNLMNPTGPSSMQKSMLANSSSGNGGSFMGMGQQGGSDGFARAPGPASSIMDNNMTQKPFGIANRSSTWSAFGTPADSEPETDLVSEFEPGKSWHGSMLMKGLDDESSVNADAASGISAFAGPYAGSSKLPTGNNQYESSGIGTWSPIVKGSRSGSKWDCDGPEGGRGDNGRFDDGTAIWGSPAQSKVVGVDWVDKTGGDASNANNDKSRSSGLAGNNQTYRPQQSSSSSASLLLSSNTSPSNQHNRNPQVMKQSISQSYDQVHQQPNALSGQANQPSRGLGLSTNVPSTQQLKHMVQQIQLAVQAGHLNPQILNQPLAPVTLQLLYQLLQQIKILQQLQVQASQQFRKPGNHPGTVNVHITKTKQNILNLQNQIAAQQAVFLKQNQAHNISSRQPTMPSLSTGGVGASIGPALPPGISQSGDSFRSSGASAINDFHSPTAMVNNFAVDSMGGNGLANSLGHMNLGGASGTGVLHSSRFDQPWRAPSAKPHQSPMASSSSPFAAHNLMNPTGPSSMQKSMLANSSSGNGGSFMGMGQQGGSDGFARAPGPASSIMDNNMTQKPFGIANRSSTWSAFGTPADNEPESEWPKSTTSGISTSNSTQPSNAFDSVPEFEPGKPWRGSMLMKSVEDDPTMTPGSMARSLAPQRKTIWSDEIL